MKKVFVFGRGSLYKQKEKYIKRTYNVQGFVDNAVSRDNEMDVESGLPVIHPEQISQYLDEDVKIILMSTQYVSMWKQLSKLGIEKHRILFGIIFPPLMDGEDVLFGDGGSIVAEECGGVCYLNCAKKIDVESHKQLLEKVQDILRDRYKRKYPIIDAISQMDTEPVSRKFGTERGTAIDRYYIEEFLEKNRGLIHGDCIEIAENTYTLRYGEDRVKNAYILHVKGWGENAIKGNLETGEGIRENQYDCAVITQTLMFIYDLRETARNIYKMLKPGSNALLTVAGISQISRYDAELWGSYYGFHEDAVKALFEPEFGSENVIVDTYGNVKTAIGLLCGLCREDLKEEDFIFQDKDYPVIITALLHKEEEVK
jgi:hypothetical protein